MHKAGVSKFDCVLRSNLRSVVCCNSDFVDLVLYFNLFACFFRVDGSFWDLCAFELTSIY